MTEKPTPGSLNIINLEKFRDTVLFSVGLKKWNNRAQVRDMAALQAYIKLLEAKESEPAEGNGDPLKTTPAIILASDRVKSSKVLIRSKAYEALCRSMNEIKAWCLERSMPSYFRSGMFVVRADQVGNVENALREKVQALEGPDGPLEKFLAAYPADVENARTAPVKKGGLGPLFRQTDYPGIEQLRKLFGFEWYWLALGVPENIPDELRAEAGEKFKRRLMDAAEDIEAALRVEFQELMKHAEERLTNAPGEKPKTFRDSMLQNIAQFLEVFDAKDVFGDQKLKAVVEETRKVLLKEDGTLKLEPQKLRELASVRETAKKTFAAIREKLDGLVEEKASRRFDFAED
jgi:hypothetical protein